VTPPPAKEVAAGIETGGIGLFPLFLRIAGVLDKLDGQSKLIKAQAAQIEALRDAVHALQGRDEVILAKGETAATLAAGRAVSDLALRVGRIEAEIERPKN
jgi:hypothetical protein